MLSSLRSFISCPNKMIPVLICSVILQAVLYATCSGEDCSKSWSTESTQYRILKGKADSYVYVSCKRQGLKVQGQDLVRCVNGHLPTVLPKCEPFKSNFHNQTSCSPLPSPVFGSIKCSSAALEVGASCEFRCQRTHYLRGSHTRKCAEDLKWTGSHTRCLAKPECPVPPELLHGSVIGCSREKKPRYNDTCHFRCNVGFKLKGSSNFKCRLHGKLTDSMGKQIFPECVRVPTVNSSAFPSSDSEGLRNRSYPISPTSWVSCQFYNGHCSDYCHQDLNGVRCSCRSGYKLSQDNKTCVVETRRVDPTTHARPGYEDFENGAICQLYNRYCSQRCHQDLNGIRCSCYDGFQLSRDGRTCRDVNECTDVTLNKCDHTCLNTVGGYTCSCRTGYVSLDGFKCEDVDECSDEKLNKCVHGCENTAGGYRCSCEAGYVSPDGFLCEACRKGSYRTIIDLACKDCPANSRTDGEGKTSVKDCICNPGFTGNPGEGIPCKDIDECALEEKNFGCSHTCINTPGSAHCACPLGYQLDEDQKTCSDVDECSIKNGGCDGICSNTIGNFTCHCPAGYVGAPHDRYSCFDVDECADENGGCDGTCVNFAGGFHCICSEGYHLHPDGKSCIPVYCPRVYVPHHSTLRCRNNTKGEKTTFHPGEMPEDIEFPSGATCRIKCDTGYDLARAHPTILCQNDGKWSASLPECKALHCPPLEPPLNGDVYPPSCKEGTPAVKQKCVFTCQSGYRITGQEVLTCRNNLTWSKKKPTQCVAETELSISCPEDDITVELMDDEGWAEIQLNSPRTNLKTGSIQVSPAWVFLDRPSVFPAGETEVTFTVTNPGDNKTADCSIAVIVLDKHPPVFSQCPDTLFVASSTAATVVDWKEPTAEDNVGVASISKSLEPNSTFGPGVHFVEYIARDFAGNVGQCMFQINVTGGSCKDLADPENGEANCVEWTFGKICQPSCFDNYYRPSELFACDESGEWMPTDFISPCLPDCPQNQTWSPELEECLNIS